MCEKRMRVLSLDSGKNKKKQREDINKKLEANFDVSRCSSTVVSCPQKELVKFWYPYLERVIQYDEVSPHTEDAYDYLNDNRSKDLKNSTAQLWSQELGRLLKKNCNELKKEDPMVYDYLVQLSRKPYLSKTLAYGMDLQDIQISFDKSEDPKEFTFNFNRLNLLLGYCYRSENLLLFFLASFLLSSLAFSLSFIIKENVRNPKTLVKKELILPFSLHPYPTYVVITLEELNTLIQSSVELSVTCSQQIPILDQHVKNLTNKAQNQTEAKLAVLSFLKAFIVFLDQLYKNNEILISLTEIQDAIIKIVLNGIKMSFANEDFYNVIYGIIKRLFYVFFRQVTIASSSSHQEKETLSASDYHTTCNSVQKFIPQNLVRQLVLNEKIFFNKKTPIDDPSKNELVLFSFYRLLVDSCPSQTRKLQKTEKTHILAVFETVRLLYWSVETEIQRHFLFFLIQHFGHFVQKKGNQRTGENVSMEDIEPNLKGDHRIDLLTLCNWKLIYTANLIVKLLIEEKHESDRTFAFCFSTMLRACIELLSNHIKFYPCVEHLLQLQFLLMTVFKCYTPLGSCLVRLGYGLVNQNKRKKITENTTLTSGLDLNKKMKGAKLFVLKKQSVTTIRMESKPLILWIPHKQLTNASLLLYTQNWIQLCHYYLTLISKHFSFPQVATPLLFNFRKLIKNPYCTIRKQLKECVKFVQDNAHHIELKKNFIADDSFQIHSNCSIFMSPLNCTL